MRMAPTTTNRTLRTAPWALSAAALFAAVSSFGVGCTVEEETGDPGPTFKYPTVSAFCQAWAEASCSDEAVTACYGSDDASLAADKKACVKKRAQGATCNPETLAYAPDTAEACLAKVTEVWADAKVSRAELDALATACVAVLSDGGAKGSSCTADADCDTPAGLRCVQKAGDAEGTCQTPVDVEAGRDCDDPAAVCEEGFYCDAGDHCVGSPEKGDACSVEDPCGEGLACEDEKCVEKLGNGEACAADAECTGGFCIKPKNAETGSCASTFTLQLTADTCDKF